MLDLQEQWAVNAHAEEKIYRAYARMEAEASQGAKKLNGVEISTADSPYYDKYNLKPYNPDSLYQAKGGYSVFDEIRTDDQVAAVMNLKKYMVLSSGWMIDGDEEPAEFLTYNLSKKLGRTFSQKIFEVLTAMDYGFSLSEKIFALDESKDFGQKIILSKLKTRPPHSFDINTDRYGNITEIVQHTRTGGITIPPSKFLHYIYQGEFDNPYGQSEFNEGVYRAYWSKNALIKFWNIYCERFGMPTTVGKIPRDAGQGDKDRFMQVLKNIQSKTSITIPDDFTVEFLKSYDGGESVYERAIDKHNHSIARKLLIPDLLGFGGKEISGGSYALGQEHFDIFYTIIEYIRQDLAMLVNEHIVRPLLLWNYGSSASAEFKFKASDKKTKMAAADMWLKAVNTGKVVVTKEAQNWFMDIVNGPEIKEEDFEADEKRRITNNPFRDRNEKGPDKDNENQEEKKPADQGKPKVEDEKPEENQDDRGYQAEAKAEAPARYREYTVYEQKVDFEMIERETEAIEKKHMQEVSDTIKLSVNALLDEVKRKKIIEKKRLDLVNKLQLKYPGRIAQALKAVMKDAYNLGKDTARSEIPEKQYAVVISGPELNNEEVVAWLAENSIYTANAEAEEILKKVKPIIMESIRNGAGTKEAMSMIDKALEGWDPAVGANRIETIIRTITNRSFNEARNQEFGKVNEFIQGYQYSAILDGRTSEVCQELDKKVFQPSEIDYYNPPNHFNCRSQLVPIFKDEELSGYDDMPATDREAGGFLVLK